jgi:hypothetical protein
MRMLMRGNLEIVRLRSGMSVKFGGFGLDVAGRGIVCSICGVDVLLY